MAGWWNVHTCIVLTGDQGSLNLEIVYKNQRERIYQGEWFMFWYNDIQMYKIFEQHLSSKLKKIFLLHYPIIHVHIFRPLSISVLLVFFKS